MPLSLTRLVWIMIPKILRINKIQSVREKRSTNLFPVLLVADQQVYILVAWAENEYAIVNLFAAQARRLR